MAYVLNRGFGASPSGSQYISAAGGSLLAAAPFTGPAAPFVAAAGAIADIIASFGVGSGCGATCVQSSNFANQCAAALQQNLSTYLALPTPRAKSAQAAAENNFMTLWNWLTSSQACGNPSLGSAGQRCISDRQRGACTWKNNGQCWDWFIGYYDPIANDPNTYDDSITASATGTVSTIGTDLSSLLPAGLQNISPVWLGLAALAALGLAVAS